MLGARGPRPDLPVHYIIAFGAEGEAPQQFWLGVRQRLMPPEPAALNAAAGLDPHGRRRGAPLTVSPRAKEALGALLAFMEAEAAAVGDSGMSQEADLLRKILAEPRTAANQGRRYAPMQDPVYLSEI